MKQTEIEIPIVTRSPELIELCGKSFGEWGELCINCPIIEPCKPQKGDTPDKLIERINGAAANYWRSKWIVNGA